MKQMVTNGCQMTNLGHQNEDPGPEKNPYGGHQSILSNELYNKCQMKKIQKIGPRKNNLEWRRPKTLRQPYVSPQRADVGLT